MLVILRAHKTTYDNSWLEFEFEFEFNKFLLAQESYDKGSFSSVSQRIAYKHSYIRQYLIRRVLVG